MIMQYDATGGGPMEEVSVVELSVPVLKFIISLSLQKISNKT